MSFLETYVECLETRKKRFFYKIEMFIWRFLTHPIKKRLVINSWLKFSVADPGYFLGGRNEKKPLDLACF